MTTGITPMDGAPDAAAPAPSNAAPLPVGVRTAGAARRNGAALVLACVAMATVSFNMTRVGGWTVSDLLFLASGAVVVMKLLNDDERFLTPRRYRSGSQIALAGILIVVTGATLSSFGSWNPLSSMMVVVRLAWSSLVWFWILRSVCRDREALALLVRAWRFSILVSALIALLGEYAGLQLNPQNFGQGRQAALTFHPGELMNFLISGFFLFLVPAFVPVAGTRRRFSTVWWLIGTGIVTLAIFATGSTSALLAIGAGAIVIVGVALYSGRSGLGRRRSPLVTISIVVSGFLGLTLLMGSDLAVAERLTGLADGTSNLDESIGSRNEVNDQILVNFDDYLLVGVGPTFFGGAANSFVQSSGASGGSDLGNVHNMYLKMLYESGFPALVGLWIIIYAIGRQALRLVSATRGTALYPVSLMLLGGFMAVNTSAMFGPVAYARHFWLPFAMVGCLWSLRRRELDEAAMARRGSELVRGPATATGPVLPARR